MTGSFEFLDNTGVGHTQDRDSCGYFRNGTTAARRNRGAYD
jgi:hypothetical protein